MWAGHMLMSSWLWCCFCSLVVINVADGLERVSLGFWTSHNIKLFYSLNSKHSVQLHDHFKSSSFFRNQQAVGGVCLTNRWKHKPLCESMVSGSYFSTNPCTCSALRGGYRISFRRGSLCLLFRKSVICSTVRYGRILAPLHIRHTQRQSIHDHIQVYFTETLYFLHISGRSRFYCEWFVILMKKVKKKSSCNLSMFKGDIKMWLRPFTV